MSPCHVSVGCLAQVHAMSTKSGSKLCLAILIEQFMEEQFIFLKNSAVLETTSNIKGNYFLSFTLKFTFIH